MGEVIASLYPQDTKTPCIHMHTRHACDHQGLTFSPVQCVCHGKPYPNDHENTRPCTSILLLCVYGVSAYLGIIVRKKILKELKHEAPLHQG